ncbi:hypothetical protein Tco_1245801 [Tanacetum coccineum]
MVLKKRHHDDKDKDPSADSEKGKKKRRQKDFEPSKDKEPTDSSMKAKAPSMPLVNVEKDPLTFDDLMGSTVDFTKFSRTSQISLIGMKILSVIRITVDKQFGYGYLKVILVRRVDQDEYAFKEADFSRLYLNDIEDMFLLYVQNKLHNLTGDEIVVTP